MTQPIKAIVAKRHQTATAIDIPTRSITFDQPGSDLTDFPALIAGTYTYLATEANGGKVKDANGYDIGFYSDATLTTKLKWETELYDPVTGQVVYWVKIPTLTSASAKVIYIGYGDPSITTDQSDKTNVWDTNYKGVWHLNTNGNDSTATPADMTATAPNPITGKIAGAHNVDGNLPKRFITSGNPTKFNITGNMTVSMWVRFTNTQNNTGIVSRMSGASCYLIMVSSITNDKLLFDVIVGGVNKFAESANTYNDGNWHYVVGRYNGSNALINVNGTADVVTGDATAGPVDGGTSNIEMGAYGGAHIYNGDIDECRISNISRSTDWIVAEYNNQNDPANFYTISAEL